MITVSEWIAIAAIIISIISFILSFIQNRKLYNENYRLQSAADYRERNFDSEMKLAEWPRAFELFGIDLTKARKDDNVSAEQITYLVLSIHALHSYCKSTGETIYDHIIRNDYRQRMFSNYHTRITWKYARELFSDYIRESIDKYISEKYPET